MTIPDLCGSPALMGVKIKGDAKIKITPGATITDMTWCECENSRDCADTGHCGRCRRPFEPVDLAALAEALKDWKCPSCGSDPDVDCSCKGQNR